MLNIYINPNKINQVFSDISCLIHKPLYFSVIYTETRLTVNVRDTHLNPEKSCPNKKLPEMAVLYCSLVFLFTLFLKIHERVMASNGKYCSHIVNLAGSWHSKDPVIKIILA